MCGIYGLLAEMPILATAAVLLSIVSLALLVLRDIFEGMPYNVAYSSAIGDVALIFGILIAVTILKRGPSFPFMMTADAQSLLAMVFPVCVIFSIVTAINGTRSHQVADFWHDFIIAPTLIFLVTALAPIIWTNGTRIEGLVALGCLLLWVALVIFDIQTGRMDQRKWLTNHGVTFAQTQVIQR